MCTVIYIFLLPYLTFLTVKNFPAGSATALVSNLIIDIAFVTIKNSIYIQITIIFAFKNARPLNPKQHLLKITVQRCVKSDTNHLEVINYMTARHPKFQVQVDGWGSAHEKQLLPIWKLPI
jgi:hypothetical protein